MDCTGEPSTCDDRPLLVLGTVRVDLGSGRIDGTSDGSDHLRPVEHALLQRLYREHGGVVSRERLYVDVWGYAPNSASRTLESTIARLRSLLHDCEQRHLVTVHGVGYALVRPPPIPQPARVDRAELVEQAGRWITANPGRWLTLAGAPGVGKSHLLHTLANRSHRGAVSVYVDVEREGRAALDDVLGCEVGPRLVFADLGRTDPGWLGGRPAAQHAHTVVLAAQVPLDDRYEAILWVR